MKSEQWLPVNCYEGHYEISSFGRVRSIDRMIPYPGRRDRKHRGKILALTPHYKNGYLSVLLKLDGVQKRMFVHRMVAEHFIPNPYNKPEVNHKKGDKNDNRVSQLEWATPLENTRHSIDIGLTRNQKAVVAIKDTAIFEFQSRTECATFLACTKSWVTSAIKRDLDIAGYKIYAI